MPKPSTNLVCLLLAFLTFSSLELQAHEDAAPWTTPGRLTLSFGENGTDIGGYPNTLFKSFGSVLTNQEIENLIIKAFQEWAVLASVNIGVVDDDVSVPFGSGGSTPFNDQVGDIRIGAVPMAGDVYAIAVEHDDLLSGGWAGTILFNSNAQFVDAQQFYAVALHEAGHILGLEHSDNLDSVMHPTALNTEFAAEDVVNIRELYGARNLDQYDSAGQSNNNMGNASDIEDSGSIRGAAPTIAFGDIGDSNDVDYFVLEPRNDYENSLTRFRLINRELSTIDLKMTVTDEFGNQVGDALSKSGGGGQGDDFSITISNTDPETEYFVRIETNPGSPHAVGSYALVTTFESGPFGKGPLDETTLSQIYPIIKRFFNFEYQEEIQELFCRGGNDCPIFDTGIDDDHDPESGVPMNDTFGTATVLEPLLEFPEGDRFREIASLSTDLTDVDFYRVTAPNCSSLFIELTAIETGGPICDVQLFDAAQNLVAGEILVNGNGELLIQYDGLTPGASYFVEVIADDPVIFAVGNYQLDLKFCRPSIAVDILAMGELTGSKRVSVHSLYVARSQLFHWCLSPESKGNMPPELERATVWMSIINQEGQVVHRIATRPNEKRSARSVVLRPGSYSIRVTISFPRSVSRRLDFSIAYSIFGEALSDPTGPEIIDASNDPFAPCDKLSNEFCYPNGQMSEEPFIIVDNDGFVPDNLPQDPPWTVDNIWYWEANWLG